MYPTLWTRGGRGASDSTPLMLRIRPVRLRTWFPPNDPVATAVAMLCILREDFLLELYGITNDSIERLDDNDEGYRRTYFWRNTLRTLEEIKKGLNRLNKQSAFRGAMLREPPEVQTAFQKLKRELNQASHEFVLNLRNTMGGHLDLATIQTALDGMDPEQEGFVQVGEILGKRHYKFAAELLWSAILQNAPEKDFNRKINELLGKSAIFTRAVKAIDDVVDCYCRDRGLP